MNIKHISFSPTGKSKWMLFLLVVVLQLAVVGFVGWRWHNITVDGIPYQWKCLPRLEITAFGTDYIRVVFPEDTTNWLDDTVPEEGQLVYVQISHDASGLMHVEGASADKPERGKDYMKATVVNFHEGTVQFKVGFDRYRIALDKTDGIYDITASDNVVASIRMKKGEGVIEGIFVNGIALEACSNGAAIEATRKAQRGEESKDKLFDTPRIVESGMVPPGQE